MDQLKRKKCEMSNPGTSTAAKPAGIEYMLPTGHRREIRPYELGLPDNFQPRRVAMLANGFPDSDKYLARQAEALKKFWPDAEFIPAVKASTSQLNIGIRAELLEKLVDEEGVDCVVIAWGHCGSCTSGVTRDAIAFESRNIPSVTLICDVFWDYAHWLGDAMGLSGIPKVQIPFPLAGTGVANWDDWATRVAPEIVDKMKAH